MGKTLSQLVNSALSEADHSIKLASARDAEVTENSHDFLADELSIPTVEVEEPKAQAKQEKPKVASDEAVLEDAAFAMKLASALDTAAGVVNEVNKVAMPRGGGAAPGPHQHTKAPGPAVMEGTHIDAKTTSPKAQSGSVPGNQASHGGGPMHEAGSLETNQSDYRDPDWTKNKEAAAALIQAKIAEAETLENMGQLDAAERVLMQAKSIEDQLMGKFAADPSSPQASMPAHNMSFKLDTEPGPASHVPDNMGMISTTKASLKDKTTREASAFMGQTPKKDNAVGAHLGRTDGQKLSSVKLSSVKLAKEDLGEPGYLESMAQGQRALRENKALQAGLGAAGGGVIGGAYGNILGRGKALPTLVGAGLGAAGLGALGHHSAKAEQKARRRLEQKAVERAMAEKGAGLDPTQLEAARVYLKKVAAAAQDPNASQEERQKAASLMEAIHERAASKQEALLS